MAFQFKQLQNEKKEREPNILIWEAWHVNQKKA